MDEYNEFIEKYAIGISVGFGILFMVIAITKNWGDGAAFCMFLLGAAVGLFVLYIPCLYKRAAKKHEIAINDWDFPLEQLLKKCAATGLIDVTDEKTYDIARRMVLSVLSDNNVPEKYHDRYTGMETIRGYFREMRSDQQWGQSEVVQKAIQFYKDCCKAKADDLSVESKREKAALIMTQYFTNANIDTILNEGRRACYAEIEAKEKKELEKISATEKRTQRELEHYKRYHGRDKLLTILRDKYHRCQEKLDELDRTSDFLLNSGSYISKPKETSWGLAGGIAEGIAGPAAGVAAAMEVQRQNAKNKAVWEAQVRAQTEVGVNAMLQLAPQIRGLKAQLKDIQQRYKKAETLLVKDDEPDMYFSMLEIGKPNISVSKTGTITVRVDVVGQPFAIYDDRPAVVDGSLTAHIFSGSKEIAQATLVFPERGAEYKTTLTGIALFCGKEGKKYSVKLSPNDLWVIEVSK